MTHISIEQYDQMQEVALEHVGNDVAWAFTPVTFGANGYPSAVRREGHLIRYADPMKEHLSRNLSEKDQFLRLYSLRTRFTPDEAKLIVAIRERVASVCQSRFGRRIVPINSCRQTRSFPRGRGGFERFQLADHDAETVDARQPRRR